MQFDTGDESTITRQEIPHIGQGEVYEEEKEIKILKSYLPQPISREEILRVIDQSIEETQASSLKDLGKVMKSVIPKLGGKADGKLINQLVKDRLSP
jgi:uncharacterized protein YqeY